MALGSNRRTEAPRQQCPNGVASKCSSGNASSISQPPSHQSSVMTPPASSAGNGSGQNTPYANPAAFTGSNTTFTSQGSNAPALNHAHYPTARTNSVFARHISQDVLYFSVGAGFTQDVIAAPGYIRVANRAALYNDLGPPFASPNAAPNAEPWDPSRQAYGCPLPPRYPQVTQAFGIKRTLPLADRDAILAASPGPRNAHPSNPPTGIITDDSDVANYYRTYVPPSSRGGPHRPGQG